MTTIILSLAAAALLGLLLYTLAAPDRYAKMSEREFQEEAGRVTMVGVAMAGPMVGLDKVLRPNRVEHVLRQKQRVDPGGRVSGDPPTGEKAEDSREPQH
jgi:hypothetical protein